MIWVLKSEIITGTVLLNVLIQRDVNKVCVCVSPVWSAEEIALLSALFHILSCTVLFSKQLHTTYHSSEIKREI